MFSAGEDRSRSEQLRLEVVGQEAGRIREDTQRAKELDSAKTRFLNLAAHELRSPLTVFNGYLAMLTDGSMGPLVPSVRRVLSILAVKAAEMNALVDEMLATARLDDEFATTVRLMVNVGRIVTQVIDDWRSLLERDQGLTVELPGEDVLIEADPARIRSIVVNLVQNAIKYSPDGGAITCRVSKTTEHAVIAVTDHGLGIAEQHMHALFSRFGRVVTPETSSIPGTGLGLYIARELARSYGGDIAATSRYGEGSTFTVSLPLAGR
jgi:signal transduction histidine kinase